MQPKAGVYVIHKNNGSTTSTASVEVDRIEFSKAKSFPFGPLKSDDILRITSAQDNNVASTKSLGLHYNSTFITNIARNRFSIGVATLMQSPNGTALYVITSIRDGGDLSSNLDGGGNLELNRVDWIKDDWFLSINASTATGGIVNWKWVVEIVR